MDECDNMVKKWWASPIVDGSSCSFLERLNSCREDLKVWNRRIKGNNFQKQIEKLEIWIRNIRIGVSSPQSKVEEARLIETLEEMTLREERFWKQRGKKHWLQLGDRNTFVFHVAANERLKTNQILRLVDPNNRVIEDKEGMQNLITQHFSEIFRSCYPSDYDLDRGTEFVSRRVDTGMNQDLLKPYTEEEIRQAVFQMAPFKSPGPDDMGGKGQTTIKLDISKAYNKVEWCFLERMLVKLGFASRFISLIMSCVKSVSFSFLLNGCEFGSLNPREDSVKETPSPPIFFLFARKLLVLCYRMQNRLVTFEVLKARYYPSSSPLEASVGTRPSLTWRSIIGTKNIILAGYRLKIGSGQNVNNPPLSSSDSLAHRSVYIAIWNADAPPKVWSVLHVNTLDPLLWMKHIATVLPRYAFAEFLVFCWYIWWSRNRLCMENISLSPMQTSTSSFINSYRDATASPTKARFTERVSVWSCPPSGVIKLNFDRVLFRNGVDIGLGVVARDQTGTVIAWMSVKFPRKADAEHTEALAHEQRLNLQTRTVGPNSFLKEIASISFASLTRWFRTFPILVLS
ncbi:UNVERIFIED_CONTAM: hypothetical protein Sradi_0464800 [Sesamum radiatum]|uniref:Reverse transcriptase n=1 Tax=Sesamum radiatum TaxID=300843 RepID=A0AAW2W748_SESRA